MRRILTFLVALVPAAVCAGLLISSAFSQSSPGLYYGQVPTAGQWNSYFAAKQDVLGYTPVNKAGDTMGGKITLVMAGTSTASANVPPGTAPSSPSSGDVWTTTGGVFWRLGSTTYATVLASEASLGAVTCGTGCSSVTGRASAFKVTTGSSVTSITVNFSSAWTAAPVCVVTGSTSTPVVSISSVSTSAITFTTSSAVTSASLYVHCFN